MVPNILPTKNTNYGFVNVKVNLFNIAPILSNPHRKNLFKVMRSSSFGSLSKIFGPQDIFFFFDTCGDMSNSIGQEADLAIELLMCHLIICLYSTHHLLSFCLIKSFLFFTFFSIYLLNLYKLTLKKII